MSELSEAGNAVGCGVGVEVLLTSAISCPIFFSSALTASRKGKSWFTLELQTTILPHVLAESGIWFLLAHTDDSLSPFITEITINNAMLTLFCLGGGGGGGHIVPALTLTK